MKYGIFSDVHGNLEALESVISQLEKEKVDQYLCLGDIVGYGANPNECVRLVKDLCSKVVAGNHDWAVVGLTDIANFNLYAAVAIQWTRSVLSYSNLVFLRELKLIHNVKESNGCFYMSHSTMFSPHLWEYVLSLDDALANFSYMKENLLFIGHSHQPIIFGVDGQEIAFIHRSIFLKIKEGYKYICNVGSVGQPRDGDRRASFAIYDDLSREIQIRRVDYDIKKAQSKIIEAHLPVYLAKRLGGGW